MKIEYKNIVLRDEVIADIEDDIRWNTVETEWSLWDAPWETEEYLRNFDPEKFRKEELERLRNPKDVPRWGFEIDTADGAHISNVSSYLIDENYRWVRAKDLKEGQRAFRAVGIEISESSYWGRGLGTNALGVFIKYLLDCGEKEIYTQTWSGNERMINCALRLGFDECRREIGSRRVCGGVYDGLTFKLRREKLIN